MIHFAKALMYVEFNWIVMSMLQHGFVLIKSLGSLNDVLVGN